MEEWGTWTGRPGARALVKYAYHVAAEVTSYSITFDKATRGGALGATIGTRDPYWLTQRPLVFVIPTKMGQARWPIESLTVDEERLTARLGPLMEKE